MNDNVKNNKTFLSTTLRKRKRKVLNIPHEEDQDHSRRTSNQSKIAVDTSQPPSEISLDSVTTSVLEYQINDTDYLDAEFGELGDLFDCTHWNDSQSGSRTGELECSLVDDQEQQPEAFVYNSFEEVEKVLTTPPSEGSSGNL